MSRRMGGLLTGMGIAGGCFVQVGAVVFLYGNKLMDFLDILILSSVLSSALYSALFARWLNLFPAIASGAAVTVAAAYFGAFLSFNLYGT